MVARGLGSIRFNALRAERSGGLAAWAYSFIARRFDAIPEITVPDFLNKTGALGAL